MRRLLYILRHSLATRLFTYATFVPNYWTIRLLNMVIRPLGHFPIVFRPFLAYLAYLATWTVGRSKVMMMQLTNSTIPSFFYRLAIYMGWVMGKRTGSVGQMGGTPFVGFSSPGILQYKKAPEYYFFSIPTLLIYLLSTFIILLLIFRLFL